ncbi:cytochrome P450 71A1-like [Salvia miltiorrhiza]|uniref:cytochrome P450 71A1-like n=1 Tax=Salvia miltiorrhiza TaxID=226208 RepID=UPI0025AB9911|nr:cytochrome P450 71A1-like [Salvia miltiorrhiza]
MLTSLIDIPTYLPTYLQGVIIIGGSDGTSAALVWALMKKVQAEIRRLVGKKDIEKLPRETIKKCSINGYEIEGGSMVFINAWAIARDPTTWENADEFLPERFLAAEIDLRGQNPTVIPFGFGRRGCPGIGIPMFEIELALANVLCKFKWEWQCIRRMLFPLFLNSFSKA